MKIKIIRGWKSGWRRRTIRVRRRPNTDQELEKRAQTFNKKYFKGQLSWNRVYYSPNQNARMFGNCNIKNRTIRISSRLLKMPKFVHDYVLIHELAHLKIPRHGSEFWKLVNKFPKTERARGYLMAVAQKSF